MTPQEQPDSQAWNNLGIDLGKGISKGGRGEAKRLIKPAPDSQAVCPECNHSHRPEWHHAVDATDSQAGDELDEILNEFTTDDVTDMDAKVAYLKKELVAYAERLATERAIAELDALIEKTKCYRPECRVEHKVKRSDIDARITALSATLTKEGQA